MCNAHDEFSTEGEAQTYGWSISHSYSTAGSTSDTPAQDLLSDIDAARSHADKLHLDINIRAFRMLLRRAVRRLSVAQFAELRRRYDNAWL